MGQGGSYGGMSQMGLSAQQLMNVQGLNGMHAQSQGMGGHGDVTRREFSAADFSNFRRQCWRYMGHDTSKFNT